MNIEFGSKIPEEVPEQTVEHIREKVLKLQKFYENIVFVVIYLHNVSSSAKEVELKVKVTTDILFVQETATNYEEALEQAYDAMSRALKKYKEKLNKNSQSGRFV